MCDNPSTITVGSRKSQLALVQTNSVINLLKEHDSSLPFDIVSMSTTGDKILDTALSQIGEKSLFTKELETSLIEEQVDFVVHSLKDLPTTLPEGLVIAAVCRRDNPADVCVMAKRNQGQTLASLPAGSTVGTSSLRRTAQLHLRHPHLNVADIRGNLNTRFRKLDETNDYDAIVLAQAGLDRLGWQDRISEVLDSKKFMYAVSQGAMAVECRANDRTTIDLLARISDGPTLLRCVAERAMLKKLEGGCHVPVAVCSEMNGQRLELQGAVFSIDGDKYVKQVKEIDLGLFETVNNAEVPIKDHVGIVSISIPSSAIQAAEDLGYQVADMLVASGAADILQAAKTQTQAKMAQHRPHTNNANNNH